MISHQDNLWRLSLIVDIYLDNCLRIGIISHQENLWRLALIAAGDLREEGDIVEWLVQNRSSGDEEDTIEQVK